MSVPTARAARRLRASLALAAALAALVAASASFVTPRPSEAAGPSGQSVVGAEGAVRVDADTDAVADASPVALLAAQAARPARARIADGVASLARTAPAQRLPVIVVSARPLPAGAVPAASHRWTWPGGEHLTLVRVRAGDAARLAELPGVAQVMDGRTGVPAQEAKNRPRATAPGSAAGHGLVAKKATTSKAAASEASASDTGRDTTDSAAPAGRRGAPSPKGWWDVGQGHGGEEAWAMGFKGEGVTAAVLDTGVDFGHPDLQGAWQVYPAGHTYAGWPEALDPDGLVRYMLDATDASDDPVETASGNGGVIALHQASPVTTEDLGGELVHTACVTPKTIEDDGGDIVRSDGEEDCDTVVPSSAGGTIRYGHHPDVFLGLTIGRLQDRGEGNGELAGVIAVDGTTPGVFDTVYIDLNGDHDFTNDTPLTRDTPLAVWDADDDGVADVSGGLLTFIADGIRPLPGSYLVGLADEIPAAGSVVSILFDAESHGTACASNIVSRGVMPPPPNTEMAYTDLPDGRPAKVNPAIAPAAKLIGMGDVYAGDIHFDIGWRFAALGADPDREDDDAQVVSNSFGVSDPDDGWDGESRVIDWYVRHLAPETLYLVATGNAGPGYGSTAAPSPATGVDVGASDQYGAQSTSSIRNTGQITFGDLIPFANRGPGATGRPGVGVTANGAVGWGAMPLNLVAEGMAGATGGVAGTGQEAQSPWGGTSRSTPVAAAAATLGYQAFRSKHGRWPTAAEAKAILFAGARFNGYDVFSTGAGTVDAGDSARIAAGKGGAYAMPPEWAVGGWRGKEHGGFAHAAPPGTTWMQPVAVHNPGSAALAGRVTGARLVRTGTIDTTHRLPRAAESRGADGVVPDWLFALDKDAIPADTDLMIIRGAMPHADARVHQLPNGLITANGFDVGIVRHSDLDEDGILWHDDNGNGAVNHAGSDDSVNWASTEVDEGEFNRATFHYGPMNGWAANMHHPLQRWGDGLYIALWHSAPVDAVAEPTIQLSIETYAWRPWSWLSTAAGTVSVPAGGSAAISASVNVPADAPTGLYEGALFIDYDRTPGDVPVPTGGGYELPQKRVVVPIVVNVAPTVDWAAPLELGGEAAAAVDGDAPAPYRQSALYGLSDYSGAESGDWRFFFLDAVDTGPDRWWLLRTDWGGEPGQSHVGTGLFGPTPDRFTDPTDPENTDENRVDTPWFGPYALGELARTLGAFDIVAPADAPAGNRQWLGARAEDGLHEVMVHSVFIDGFDVSLPFTTTVGSVRIDPPEILLRGTECTTVTVESTLDVLALATVAGGLSKPEVLLAQPISTANDTVNILRRFTQPVLEFAVDLVGEEGNDLDMSVFFDTNRNNRPEPSELIGASESPTAEEFVSLPGQGAPGTYIIQINAFALATDATTFDLTIDAVSGDDITARDAPGALIADAPSTLRVCPVADLAADPDAGTGAEGLLTFGPEEAPGIVRVPVRWAPEGDVVGRIWLPVVQRGHERP